MQELTDDILLSSDNEVSDPLDLAVEDEEMASKSRPVEIVWKNVFRIGLIHVFGLYGLYLLPSSKPLTWIWTIFYVLTSLMGITAGAHRLWTHRSYRAKTPLKILLAIFNSMGAQNDIIEWSRDHRVHHKYSETDADPHNAKRGLFFSHVGWLMCHKHPDVKEKGKLVDISDLLADPVCRIQRKFYIPSVILLCFVLPTLVPWYFWNEGFWNSYCCNMFRYIWILNGSWATNSINHMWGSKPYDCNINPTENWFMILFGSGEGFHNYHHTFPGDYAASEFGELFNITTLFIDCMATLGQVDARKKISPELVKRRRERAGDGSHTLMFL